MTKSHIFWGLAIAFAAIWIANNSKTLAPILTGTTGTQKLP